MGGVTLLTAGLMAPATQAQSPEAQISAQGTSDGPAVLTHHNNIARTGANLLETQLNTNNVRPDSFGKLFTRKVDGQIYAQPLYVPGMFINGKKRNVVFVATMHSTVYAFDADDPNASEPLWKTPFLNDKKGIIACPIWEVGWWDTNIWPEVGIVSTPVIDVKNGFLICVSKTKEVDPADPNNNAKWRYPSRIHKLNLLTGQEVRFSNVEVKATVPGTGDGANGDGSLSFYSRLQMNRPGLLLMNDTVFIAFGAHSDTTPYHGWVFAYDAKYLTQKAVWCSTPNGKTDPSGYPIGAGGIWQSGQGLTADSAGNIYFEIGNGSFSADKKGVDYGDSFVKLRLNTTIPKKSAFEVLDYFTPYNQDWLNRVDADLGVSGPMLIPGTDLLVGGGKGGVLYLLNKNQMGGYNPNGDTQIPQWLWTFPAHLHGAPVYWDSAAGSLVYVWGENDRMKAYKLDKAKGVFQTTPFAMSDMYVPWGMPGATLSVSADGSKPGTGIVWAAHPYDDDAIHKIVPGILRAFDAATLKEVWNSKMVAERDDVGLLAKFCPPTIINGKVYLATFSNELAVYGLGKWVQTPTISPQSGEYAKAINITITDGTPGAKIYYTLDGSEPTQNSLPYVRPFLLTQSKIVKARAFTTNLQPSATALAKYLVNSPVGTGDGLQGNYFANLNFSGTPVARIDATLDFPNWGGVQPIAGVGPDNWTARWTGKVQPRTTGNYTFTTNSDDGVRLWVNGQLVVDNWTYHAPTENSGTIFLEQGKKYDVKLEFFQGGGGAVIQLYWASDFFNRQLVPQKQLYSK